MPRPPVEDNLRVSLRIRSSDKATIMRAATLEQTDITNFVLRTALREAQAIIARAERIKLSERDTDRVLELLENPPAPNSKLRAAARRLPDLE